MTLIISKLGKSLSASLLQGFTPITVIYHVNHTYPQKAAVCIPVHKFVSFSLSGCSTGHDRTKDTIASPYYSLYLLSDGCTIYRAILHRQRNHMRAVMPGFTPFQHFYLKRKFPEKAWDVNLLSMSTTTLPTSKSAEKHQVSHPKPNDFIHLRVPSA